jgi:hypothetical protein
MPSWRIWRTSPATVLAEGSLAVLSPSAALNVTP